MNTIKFIVAVSIVLLGTDLIYYQVVNGQNNDTAKTMVDKLIQDTKIENATEESYRAELIQRMQNTTCLNTNLEGIGSVPLNTDILKTSELEGLLKTCVKEGIIK
jgi:hypothetical protein